MTQNVAHGSALGGAVRLEAMRLEAMRLDAVRLDAVRPGAKRRTVRVVPSNAASSCDLSAKPRALLGIGALQECRHERWAY